MVLLKVLVFLVVKALDHPNSLACHTLPLCKACPHAFRGRRRNLEYRDRDRASYLGVRSTEARRTAQQMGGSHLLPLGVSPMQGVNQYGQLANTALQFFIFFISVIQQWYNVTNIT